jgi:hypothetical protein
MEMTDEEEREARENTDKAQQLGECTPFRSYGATLSIPLKWASLKYKI